MADAETNNLLSRSLFLTYLLGKIRRRRRTLETAVTHLLSKRRHLLSISLFLLLLTLIQRNDVVTPIRSCRRLTRNNGWWATFWNNYSDARFKKTFIVTRATFLYILSRIRHRLERQTVTEEPISPELRLALCL